MAKNSLESRLMEQSDMIMQLNKIILSLQQTIESFNAREAAMLQEIQTLKEQNDYLTKKLFGKSSEKNSWDMDGQLNLFNEAEQEQDISLLEEEQEETKTVTFTVKKDRSADKDRYAGLPVEKKYLDVPEEERFCPDCESPLLEIGDTFVRRELKFKPVSFLGNRSMRVYSGDALEGKMLIAFAALILRNRMYTKLKDEEEKLLSSPNYMNVPAAIRELEKIEMIRQADGVYRLDHAVTANQKTILKAFGIDANYVKRKTQQISNELNPKVLKVKINGGKNSGKKI